MKILLIGEYSNVHATLAAGLREQGHQVIVASNGDYWKNYPRDINLKRGQKWYSGLVFLFRVVRALPKMKGFDVVQLINPLFMELTPKYLRPIYSYLRRHNKRLVMGAFGMDHYWVKACVEKKFMRYSDFNMGNELRTDAEALRDRADWTGTEKAKLNETIANDCDAIVSGLYEYHLSYSFYFPEKTTFIPFPIRPQHPTICVHQPVRVFIGINKSRSVYKGTDIMLQAAQQVEQTYPDKMRMTVVENVPFAQYERMVGESDILLDQLYSYTPAMNALMAMSKGVVAVGGGEPEQYDLLNEKSLRPIANVEPRLESVVQVLTELVLSPEKLERMKNESVEYINRHHDYLLVAKRYLALYNSLLQEEH